MVAALTYLPTELVQRIFEFTVVETDSQYWLYNLVALIDFSVSSRGDRSITEDFLTNYVRKNLMVLDLTCEATQDSILRAEYGFLKRLLPYIDMDAQYIRVVDLETSVDKAQNLKAEKLIVIFDEFSDLKLIETFFPLANSNSNIIEFVFCVRNIKSSFYSPLEKLHIANIVADIDINTLYLDFVDSNIYSDQNFFGIFDPDIFQLINKNYRNFFSKTNEKGKKRPPICKKICFPFVETLNLDYMALDSFFNSILHKLTTKIKTFERNNEFDVDKNLNLNSTTTVAALIIKSILQQFFNNFHISFPNLVTLNFIKMSTYPNNNEITQCCNFIDLSSYVLNKCLSENISINFLFQLHSLKNWSMPKIKEFTGHKFKYDETTFSGSPERYIKSLRGNIKILQEMAINETNDGTCYFRVKLIPEGVEKTQIINWIPFTSSFSDDTFKQRHHLKRPMICLKNNSLRSLTVKIIRIEKCSSIRIQGFYLPNLQELFINNTLCDTTQHQKQASNDMSCIEFTSWNELPQCKKLGFAQLEDDSNYVLNISNLQDHLPNLDLRESFPTFFDIRQKFVVV
ncbi:HN1_G0029120.mRNA.1.CDS.1 [Saccharomyces cerevisiae]|nr:HN1_G0029120.mRNA.1.CDS.1 [Saccharomyces cerevisiae]CAI4617197.1 BAL_1a_G0036880.mRNA.1.CDS.1 [Saccharomyces cerevisiae]CAI7237990.1 BAL_1a_G0036880.mRNA.1.CDS.1 [Saccharomyces cerevisiae]